MATALHRRGEPHSAIDQDGSLDARFRFFPHRLGAVGVELRFGEDVENGADVAADVALELDDGLRLDLDVAVDV